MKIDKKTTWNALYKGVAIEVVHWQMDWFDGARDCWNHYLYIHLDRMPEQFDAQSLWLNKVKLGIGNLTTYRYESVDLFAGLDWGEAGSITFYEKISGFEGGSRIIKIGCDYQHSWNTGPYDEQYILLNAKATVDSFIEKIPEYKHWCIGNGNLYRPSEGEILPNGKFQSFEYKKELAESSVNSN